MMLLRVALALAACSGCSADVVLADGEVWRGRRHSVRKMSWAGDWEWFGDQPPLGPLDLVCLGGVVTLAIFYAGDVGKRPTAEQAATRDDLERELMIIAEDSSPGYQITPEFREFLPHDHRRGEPNGLTGAGIAKHCTNDLTAIMKIAQARPEAVRKLLLAHAYNEQEVQSVLNKFSALAIEAARLTNLSASGAAFARFDLDGSGSISKEELGRVLKKLDSELFSDERVESVFAAMDKNSDRMVSYTEFVDFIFSAGTNARSIAVDQVTRDVAHKAVEIISSGQLDAETCSSWRKEHGSGKIVLSVSTKRRDVRVDGIESFFCAVQQMKEDGLYDKDRQIVLPDASHAHGEGKTRKLKLRDVFDSMDANKNGKVTMSEFKAGMHSLGLDCDDEVMANIFSMIDKEQTIRRKSALTGSGVSVQEWKTMSKEEQERHKREHGPPVVTPVRMRDGLLSFSEFKKAFNAHVKARGDT